jgi:hypothetical protein
MNRLYISSPPLLIPANSLIIQAQGPHVAVVTEDQTVHVQRVKLCRDYGVRLDRTMAIVQLGSGPQGRRLSSPMRPGPLRVDTYPYANHQKTRVALPHRS